MLLKKSEQKTAQIKVIIFSEKVKISTTKNCSRKRPGWEKAPGRLSIHL
jgi:hypothetical protein